MKILYILISFFIFLTGCSIAEKSQVEYKESHIHSYYIPPLNDFIKDRSKTLYIEDGIVLNQSGVVTIDCDNLIVTLALQEGKRFNFLNNAFTPLNIITPVSSQSIKITEKGMKIYSSVSKTSDETINVFKLLKVWAIFEYRKGDMGYSYAYEDVYNGECDNYM